MRLPYPFVSLVLLCSGFCPRGLTSAVSVSSLKPTFFLVRLRHAHVTSPVRHLCVHVPCCAEETHWKGRRRTSGKEKALDALWPEDIQTREDTHANAHRHTDTDDRTHERKHAHRTNDTDTETHFFTSMPNCTE